MSDVKPKSAKEAKAMGLKTYYTGQPCKRGGIAERSLNGDCQCRACKDFLNVLRNNWAKNNKDKMAEWRANNKEKMHAYKMAYQERNRDLQNKRIADWKAKNQHKVLSYTHKRNSIKRNSMPSWYGEFDDFVMEEAADLAKRREVATGIKWNIDHMIPLASKTACGLHWHKNIQVIPEKLNLNKHIRMIFTEPNEWIKAL